MIEINFADKCEASGVLKIIPDANTIKKTIIVNPQLKTDNDVKRDLQEGQTSR